MASSSIFCNSRKPTKQQKIRREMKNIIKQFGLGQNSKTWPTTIVEEEISKVEAKMSSIKNQTNCQTPISEWKKAGEKMEELRWRLEALNAMLAKKEKVS